MSMRRPHPLAALWAGLRAAVLATTLVSAAQAGRPCEEQPQTTEQVRLGMALALQTARALEASGAQVVMLARAGQDLSEYGLRWSHLGLAYRDQDEAGRPLWRVAHKLNHCGSNQADVFRQGLGDFFLDRPHRYVAAYSVLSPALQQALLPALRDDAWLARLHEPRYSMVAYPWAQRYQQSNQWALESLASVATAPPAASRAQAQAWLREQGYQPSDLRLSAWQRLGARVGMAHVAFDDHPNTLRYSGHIHTTSADSVFAWLTRAQLGQPARIVTLAPQDLLRP